MTSVRGRPQEIGDEQLLRALREIEFVLDQSWGAIGWTLKDADSITDIQTAFSSIEQFNYSWLDIYRERETEPATLTLIRRLRKDLDLARNHIRQSNMDHVKAKESLERAQYALQTTVDLIQVGKLRTLQAKFLKSHTEARDDMEASRERSALLESALWRQEAYLAQSQLLAFIRSDRFTFTPVNLAKAMAGLPRLTARSSHERCHLLENLITPGLEFVKFRAVEAVLTCPVKSVSEGVDKMRAYLCSPESSKSIALADLRKNWYFLQTAIESKWEISVCSNSALAFRIFADYQRRAGVMGQADVLLAAEAQL